MLLSAARKFILISLCAALLCLGGYAHAQTEKTQIKVTLTGLKDDVAKQIRPILALDELNSRAEINEGDVRLFYRRGRKQIETALESFGLYRAKVSGELQKVANTWEINYQVDPGEQVRYAQVSAGLEGEGEDDPEIRAAIDKITALSGQGLDHGIYEGLKNDLLRTTLRRGYLDAELTRHEVRVNMRDYAAVLSLSMNTGMLYRFGTIRINQDFLDDDLVSQFMDIKPGMRYSARALLDQEQTLYDTDYFGAVNIVPLEDAGHPGEVPLRVDLEPRKTSQYKFGLGYFTDRGAGVSAGWERRYVNRAGHRFNLDAKVFQIGSDISARYRVPVRNPRTDELTLFAEYRDDEPETSFSRISRFGALFSTLWRRSRIEYSLVYHVEDFEVADNDDVVNMLIPGVSVSYTSSRDPVKVRHGFRIDTSARGAAENFVSEITFGQLHLRGKYIYSPWKRGRFLLRGEAGLTGTPELQELPASLRYFAGGDQSVRGYPYKSLGPRNSDGDVIGGRQLLVGSLEYEHALTDTWAVAVFLDAGNAFNDAQDFELERGAGVGVRWRSPVGPVRVDLANAVSDPDRGWRLHISIGPDL